MTKTKKIVYYVIAIVVGYFAYSIFYALMHKHEGEFFNCKRYSWIFNDTIKKEIDTSLCVGDIRESDVYYTYKIKNTFIQIWEFRDLRFFDLKNTAINQNVNLEEIKFYSGEILNKNSWPEITVKYQLPFDDFLNVNLNENSTLIKKIEAKNYKGFYGTINQMSISNADGEHFILFDYPNKIEPVLFLLYKKGNHFYMILIDSKEPFDENIIKILNLQ